jgi:hypothetical protein
VTKIYFDLSNWEGVRDPSSFRVKGGKLTLRIGLRRRRRHL